MPKQCLKRPKNDFSSIRIVKDLFHLLDSNDNPEKSTGEDLATSAFKEMDVNSDGQVRKIEKKALSF